MKKYLIFTLTLLACISLSYAQDEDTGSSADDESGEMGAKAGDFTGAIMFGRGHYLDQENPPSAPRNNTNWTVNSSAPTANIGNANYNSMSNIVGGEVRYFITDLIAVKLTGGAVISNSPGLQNVQYFSAAQGTYQSYDRDTNGDGSIDGSDTPSEYAYTNLMQGNDPSAYNSTWIPQYGSIVTKNDVQTNVSVGGEYHFPSSRFDRLKPYLGAQFTYAYSRRSQYDPSVYYANVYDDVLSNGGAEFNDGSLLLDDNGTSSDPSDDFYYWDNGNWTYGGNFPNGSLVGGGTSGNIVEDAILIYDVGIRSAVVQGLGGHAVAGIDVYLVPGVYVGIETKPVSYWYNWNEKSPGPGLETLQAKTNTWSFFSQTFFKIGFIVGKL